LTTGVEAHTNGKEERWEAVETNVQMKLTSQFLSTPAAEEHGGNSKSEEETSKDKFPRKEEKEILILNKILKNSVDELINVELTKKTVGDERIEKVEKSVEVTNGDNDKNDVTEEFQTEEEVQFNEICLVVILYASIIFTFDFRLKFFFSRRFSFEL